MKKGVRIIGSPLRISPQFQQMIAIQLAEKNLKEDEIFIYRAMNAYYS
jgi:hypothetical protein